MSASMERLNQASVHYRCLCHTAVVMANKNLLVRVRGPDAYQCGKQKWSMLTGLASGQHGTKSI